MTDCTNSQSGLEDGGIQPLPDIHSDLVLALELQELMEACTPISILLTTHHPLN